jgi:hypothetical protein
MEVLTLEYMGDSHTTSVPRFLMYGSLPVMPARSPRPDPLESKNDAGLCSAVTELEVLVAIRSLDLVHGRLLPPRAFVFCILFAVGLHKCSAASLILTPSVDVHVGCQHRPSDCCCCCPGDSERLRTDFGPFSTQSPFSADQIASFLRDSSAAYWLDRLTCLDLSCPGLTSELLH